MNELLHIKYDWSAEEGGDQWLPTFDLSDYESVGNVVMHCPSPEKADVFLRYLDAHGYCWCTGFSYRQYSNWDRHKEDTCYRFLKGTYQSLQYFINDGYEILEFDDFDWSD